MLFWVYKHTNEGFFYDFLKISEHFPKIFEDSQIVLRRSNKRFRTFSDNIRRFPKINGDIRGRSDDVSITHQHIKLQFKGNLVLSTKLIINNYYRDLSFGSRKMHRMVMWIGHRKENRNVSCFRALYGGQFTLSTQLIKPNYLVILPTDAAPQFRYSFISSF